MTIEEAIQYFENRLESVTMPASREAFALALSTLRSQQEAEKNPGKISDGYHTFNELYHHRAVLFSVICNEHSDLAWKSKRHHDPAEQMYNGMFVVGINTPDGQATYHYDVDPYWDMFHVKELECAPEWDGHTPAQAIERIGKLVDAEKNKPLTLAELREMDGQPVYVMSPDQENGFFPGWCLVDAQNERVEGVSTLHNFKFYYTLWRAFRRKPEVQI